MCPKGHPLMCFGPKRDGCFSSRCGRCDRKFQGLSSVISEGASEKRCHQQKKTSQLIEHNINTFKIVDLSVFNRKCCCGFCEMTEQSTEPDKLKHLLLRKGCL